MKFVNQIKIISIVVACLWALGIMRVMPQVSAMIVVAVFWIISRD